MRVELWFGSIAIMKETILKRLTPPPGMFTWESSRRPRHQNAHGRPRFAESRHAGKVGSGSARRTETLSDVGHVSSRTILWRVVPGRRCRRRHRARGNANGPGRGMSIEYSSSVDHSIETVFAWHERPGALAATEPALAGCTSRRGGGDPRGRPCGDPPPGPDPLGGAASRLRPAAPIRRRSGFASPAVAPRSLVRAGGPDPDAHHRHGHDSHSRLVSSNDVRLPAHPAPR